MTDKKVILSLKLDKELKDSFARICKREGLTSSLVMRELMKDYIRKNGQGDLLK